jgi:pimeloyl-ACP methyl ester carboxylesterase
MIGRRQRPLTSAGMLKRAPILLLVVALAQCVSAILGVSPAGALTFVPCATSITFSCTTVPVPLTRTGLASGTISLSIERKQAGPVQSKTAVLALAGGPGQAALPLGEFIAKALAPALTARDLLVFDQRGTGSSDPLSCGALSSFSGNAESGAFEHCALEIGPARGGYTTQESVEDIEAIRQAAGYEKLVLYGTSYGTKVAEEYAERYPQHVESLVLDSVVLPDGPEPFSIPTFQAIGSVLGELCANNACAGITSNPVADIASLAARLSKHPLSGSVYDGSGHRHNATLNESGLFGILEAGDLNPALRALLPAAVRSALSNYPDPLLRLQLLAEGLIPNVPGGHPVEESSEEIDEALFVTTTCEEAPFPWQRSAPAATRLAEALGALHALPSTDFYPFDADTALNSSLISDCAGWPDASAANVVPGVLPNVPTLILSGAQDLRTPTSNARSVAALIPDAQLLVVPFTGHSVLGSDFSGCAEAAVTAFFAGGAGVHPILPCTTSTDMFAPTPLTPTKLNYVHPVPGLSGKPGLTLTAVLDTIIDLNRQVIGATLQADSQLPSGSSFGGLRGGDAKLSSSRLELNHFTFVPGVELSGTFPVSKGQLQTTTLRVSGSTAAGGTVRVGSGKLVTGTLGGKRFDIDVAKVKLSRTGASNSDTTNSDTTDSSTDTSGWSTGRSLISPVASPLPGPIVRDQPARLR